MLILTLLYLISLVTCITISTLIIKDKHFARLMGFKTWIGLSFLLVVAFIPLLNFIVGICMLIHASENDAFQGGLNIHKPKKEK